MVDAVSKTHMAIAGEFEKYGYKISESRKQNGFEQIVAKLSYLLHNLFVNGTFDANLADDDINETVLEVAKKCHKIILST